MKKAKVPELEMLRAENAELKTKLAAAERQLDVATQVLSAQRNDQANAAAVGRVQLILAQEAQSKE